MSWQGTKTWAVSDTLTASDMNSYVRDNTAYLFQKAEVAMKKSAVSLNNNSLTTVSFTAGSDDIFDTFGMHVSGQPTRLSVVSGQTGSYWCHANVIYDNGSGRRLTAITKNSTLTVGREDTGAADSECSQSPGGPANMTNVGDYIDLALLQSSGGTLNAQVLSFGMWHVGQ